MLDKLYFALASSIYFYFIEGKTYPKAYINSFLFFCLIVALVNPVVYLQKKIYLLYRKYVTGLANGRFDSRSGCTSPLNITTPDGFTLTFIFVFGLNIP